ncbi:hypothetical protein DRF65_06975 [Chryseobacterium pennae]|uniref:Lipoprotein n=1 Tax=Chryseobacterium pennae TaxID=2258962 RepID=A0A3D9CBR4_9FLAO|nr:DUF6624 domain-containing protein [Chryseobacterium pennae]REC62971.1 hypothetical protein DRF65_06975 [Chryseobacterium pennae]
MKKILLSWAAITFISCNSNKNISASEREKIISELNYIGKIDQKFAGIPPADMTEKYGKNVWKIFEAKRDSVGKDNQNRIKKLYSQYGYLGFKQVGKENSTQFWLPIQHADHDIEFQKTMLVAMQKEVNRNNASKNEYALLEDRIAVNTHQKQRFGTQVTYNNFEQAVPKNGLIDSANVEKLRAKYDLPTLKEYYNGMTERHFKMNEKVFLQRGITEPKLYK